MPTTTEVATKDEPPRGDPPGGADAARRLPAWYPAWAREVADLYFSGTTCLFVLHGNVHDLVRRSDGDGPDAYCGLVDFLALELFGGWDVVLRHDLGHGLRPVAGADRARLQGMMQFLSGHLGPPAGWPKNPDEVLLALDRLVERNLLDQADGKFRSLAIVFEYAQYLVPEGGLQEMAGRTGGRLVRLLEWAQNPYVKRVNTAFCLIADRLSEVSERLIHSPHVATVEIPMPGAEDRERFVRSVAGDRELTEISEFDAAQLARSSNGLSLVNVNLLLSQARRTGKKIDAAGFKAVKKSMIERQCAGLLEFVEPGHTLDLIVGHEAARKRLEEDAALVAAGRLSAAPMGYLICGPVGTGKTFLAECYAGSIGIPCVKLRNFRSKYVGETEGNLERVLSVLRSLGPVLVMIDEADAALGTRQAEGDSGTSSRVFSMIASQMGDTRYRGRILWMLMTSRPDLLPVDLKRQGRAEVHIPLFYPEGDEEVRTMFRVMARKNKMPATEDALAGLTADARLSGADIESVVLAATRTALTAGRAELTGDDLRAALANFIPSSQGLEKESQEINAVLECTQLDFLPPRWREAVSAPDGRAALQQRLAVIRATLLDR